MISSPAAFIIRAATAEDAPRLHAAILSIAEQVGTANQVRSTAEDLRHFGFGGEPAFEAVVAEVESAFAGMCLFFPVFSTWIGRPGVFVQDLFVHDGFRSLGLGERLLRHVAEYSRERGARYMCLSVAEDNRRAQEFYSRLGLAWSNDERSFIARGPAFEALCAMDRDQSNIRSGDESLLC